MDLHVRFTTDGRALVYDDGRQFGYALKGGPFHLWQIVDMNGRPCGKPSPSLSEAVASVAHEQV